MKVEQSQDFDVANFIDNRNLQSEDKDIPGDMESFVTLWEEIKVRLDEIDSLELTEVAALKRKRDAILGEKNEVEYYKGKIKEILNETGQKRAWHPSWYSSIEDAIYNEILGFAGINEWIQGKTEALKNSSSCKIIGERIYFLINGIPMLQPQKISAQRRGQLREALLLPDPTQNRAESYHEVYLNNGIRVAIYNDNGMTKKGQDCIVLRKYTVNVFTFEKQAELHTIPEESIPLFKSMVPMGINIAFTGPVRSAKTTFLTTYQSYENPQKEGLMIEKDPEIPLHEIMPDAPIMQFVPSDKNVDAVIAYAKRSDSQYVILGEAKDGIYLNLAVEAANMGTLSSKLSFHSSVTKDFVYDVAVKIIRDCGGELMATMIKVAKSFHYVANFFSLPGNESQKRLKGLWEVRFNEETLEITMHQICKYDVLKDDWVWAYDIGGDKKELGAEENREAFQEFDKQLKYLSERYPNKENHVFKSPYMQILRGCV